MTDSNTVISMMRLFAQWLGRIALILLCIVIAGAVILFAILLIISKGKPKPFLDKDGKVISGSISEKVYVDINGVKQGMFIEGKNRNNPMILFLHGGPGMPEYFLAEKNRTGLEDDFTVCYWEQRGSGLSYHEKVSADSETTEQLIADTIIVTNYLRKRFGQQKIYLMGHSWGTYLGIQVAARAPQLYEAYIGIGQVSQQYESEIEAYQFMLAQYKVIGNTDMIKRLEAYPIAKSETAMNAYLKSSLRDEAMHKLGIGTMHGMKSVITGVFVPVMQCQAYTFGEKINIWRGKAFLNSTTDLRRQMDETDLTVKIPRLEVPTYFMSGIYDYTVSHTLAKNYFQKIEAPVKGFYLFEESAHSPMFEEPEKFVRIMQEDVLAGKNSLADVKCAEGESFFVIADICDWQH